MKTKLEESQTCCCVDVGAVIDGEERNTEVKEVFADKAGAEARLADLSAKAEKAHSDEYDICSDISEVEQGFQLSANFTFSCQAENLIFQLSQNR